MLPMSKVEAWKLLYASMLFSGNDSALALGIAVAGILKAHRYQADARTAPFGTCSAFPLW